MTELELCKQNFCNSLVTQYWIFFPLSWIFFFFRITCTPECLLPLIKLTSSPPGRLTDDRRREESNFAWVSTFHLLCWTSMILPITTSPISPLYLDKIQCSSEHCWLCKNKLDIIKIVNISKGITLINNWFNLVQDHCASFFSTSTIWV